MNLITQEIRAGTPLAGRYRVRRRLGTGGMATVFLAEDERLGREVAIKRLHTDAPRDSLLRFKREARLGAALNHPNLVAVYDTIAADEGALIVMEHVQGRTLAEVADGRPMRSSKAVPILREVARALDHAHAQDVVHRDVKPGNILVGDDGVVKLADLGIARAIGATQITSEDSVVGTLPYMSPERLSRPGGGGPESDVYSLAAVAYELLSGSPPGDGPLSSPQVPPGAIAVLERGLDEDPGRRQLSAGTLVDELEPALRPGAALPPTMSHGRGTRPTEPRFGRPLAIGMLVLGLLAAGGLALSAGGGDDGDPAGKQAEENPAKEPKPDPNSEPDPAADAPAPEPASAEPSATELNDLGFSLIQQGRYQEAIPLLQGAVDGLGGGADELTYGYALYNLGHALRMAGRPEEAIPILEQRLEIPNQRGTVMRELDAAYADAGIDSGGGPEERDGPGNGNGHGKAKGHDED
jgi:eukaryotic-like serine/threonine-protein kinase